jgi:hypothetical protein
MGPIVEIFCSYAQTRLKSHLTKNLQALGLKVFVIPLGFPDKNRDHTSHPSFCCAKKKTTFSCCLFDHSVIPLGFEPRTTTLKV